MKMVRAAALLFLALIFSRGAALAQDYPAKPIRLIVAFPAGGISDVLGRALAAKMSTTIGQQVIVENRPGAGTTIAADYIARSAPDGYTLFLQDMTSHAINASLYAKLPYDSVKDFTPIGLVASTPLMLVVHPSNPAHNVRELIGWLKSNRGKVSYGSSGNGTILHLASELFNSAAGMEVLHVPYKGSAPATQAILTGEVAYVFSTMPPAISHVKSGRLRALAVTTPKRVSGAPEVPTMIEAGVPNYEVVLFSGILGPSRMSAALAKRINAEFVKVVATEEIKAVYEKLGADPVTGTPGQLAAQMVSDIAKLSPVVKATGVRIE